MRMQNSVLNISKEQVEKAIEILNPCMNDYIYVFDLKEDYYIRTCDGQIPSAIR